MAHNPGQKNVTGIAARGVGKQGNPKPYTSMPANNITNNKPKMGNNAGTSILGSTSKGKGGGQAAQSGGKKVFLPTHNNGKAKVNLGHTAHGVGEVPSYLKGQN